MQKHPSPMHISISKAIREDMSSVLSLIQELAIYEKEPDAVKITEDTLIEFGLGDQPLFTCFVAKVDGDIVGMALVYYRFSTWQGKSLHLEDLVIKESFRGKGVGKKLYDRVMQFGQENNVKRVEWVVLDWNKNAIDFYEKSGAQFLKDWYLVQMDEERLEKYVSTL
jgi:GNAT superfamily N-acetyltransferase